MRMQTGVLAVALCVSCTNYPTTWEGRYTRASKELAAASTDEHRFYTFGEMAKAAFELGKIDQAAQAAQQAIDVAPRFRDNWNYGNAIHDGHMVLGRVALRRGDIETAKRELIAAGSTPGSPQLDSFGPNVSLARDLIQQNQVDPVVEYFSLCAKFWKMEDGKLRRWTVLAKGGEMPDFGANLDY